MGGSACWRLADRGADRLQCGKAGLRAAAQGDVGGGAPGAQAGGERRGGQELEQVTRAAFGQRRKMVRQSLKATGVAVEGLLAVAGLKGDERAEDLPGHGKECIDR